MKTKILILGLLALAAVAAPVKKVGPPAPEKAEASFRFERKSDTAIIRRTGAPDRKVPIPGVLLFTWKTGKGDSLVWDADSGKVISGDSAVSFAEFREATAWWFSRLQESDAARRTYDSAASDAIGRAWSILNPKR